MRSIMVLNSKGGSGKSTIATNIASYYATQGNKVILVDCDPQASSLEWLAARPSGRSTISGVDAANGHFRAPRSAEFGSVPRASSSRYCLPRSTCARLRRLCKKYWITVALRARRPGSR